MPMHNYSLKGNTLRGTRTFLCINSTGVDYNGQATRENELEVQWTTVNMKYFYFVRLISGVALFPAACVFCRAGACQTQCYLEQRGH